MIQCTPDHSYVRFLAFYMMQLCIYLSYMCVSILSIYHSIYIYIFTNYYHTIVILYIYMCELCRIDYVIHVEISFPINVSMCEWKV